MSKKIVITVFALVVIAGIAGYSFVNNQAAQQIDILIAQALENGDYQELSYESVEMGLPGEFTLTNLHVVDITGNDFIIEEVQIQDYDFINEVPEHMTISAKGLKLPNGIPGIDLLQAENPALHNLLGTIVVDDSIPLAMAYHYDYEPDNEHLLVSDMTVGIDDALNFSINSTLKNVPLAELNQASNESPEEAQMFLMSYLAVAELPQISLQLEDLGVLDLLLQAQGEESGISAEAMRQQMTTQAESLILFVPPQMQALAKDVSNQLTIFLEGGKTFSISLEPEYEGNIQRLQPEIMSAVFSGEYDKIFSLLNLEIKAQ